jgi:hypothetical protein
MPEGCSNPVDPYMVTLRARRNAPRAGILESGMERMGTPVSIRGPRPDAKRIPA